MEFRKDLPLEKVVGGIPAPKTKEVRGVKSINRLNDGNGIREKPYAYED